jgi:hypothetical protein
LLQQAGPLATSDEVAYCFSKETTYPNFCNNPSHFQG